MSLHQLESALKRDPLLVAILGPTGSGKTALSLSLAERFHGEIVNCDSVALYRELIIGAAKPTAEESSRAPHHLFDLLDPTSHATAGEYSRRARQAVGEISGRGHLPIVAGGTGLYLRALLEGLFHGPERSEEIRERLRDRAQKHGSQYLHGILTKLDPAAAQRIHANDLPKLIRAIEVCLAARQPITEQWKSGRVPLPGFRILRIGLDPSRALLYARINQRGEQMFADGLVAETRNLLEKYGPSALALNSIGYKQVVQHLKGELDLNATIRAVQQVHRNYAKRQLTWFRREPEVRWLNGFGDDPAIQAQAEDVTAKDL